VFDFALIEKHRHFYHFTKSALKSNGVASGTVDPNGHTNGTSTILRSNGVANGTAISNHSQSKNRENRFVPNKCPKFPLPPLDALLDAYLTGLKAFATPEEFENTTRLAEEFKRPGSKGRLIYDRAAARYADAKCENWEHELQLRRGVLDRRASLVPILASGLVTRSASASTRKRSALLCSHSPQTSSS
jgi:hypothetical protein